MQLNRFLASFDLKLVFLELSRNRIELLGWCMLLGNPLFHFLWVTHYVQPYESFALRVGGAFIGLSLILVARSSKPESMNARRYVCFALWLQLPVATSYMLVCNQFNLAWVATFVTMVFVYHAVMHWQLAFVGLLSGCAFGIWVANSLVALPLDSSLTSMQVPLTILGFSWFCALVVDISATNLKQKQIEIAYTAIGVIAHEMRTPLASVHLLGVAFANEANKTSDINTKNKLTQLVAQLEKITNNLNAHLDTQIINVRFDRLPTNFECISMQSIVQSALDTYPFRTAQERASLVLHVHSDFVFLGSEGQTRQLIHNLIKNAFTALMRNNLSLLPGVVQLDVCSFTATGKLPWSSPNCWGQLQVKDKALGISPEVFPRLFDPFISTERNMGHGLGLAFCKQVARAMGAKLTVKTELQQGSTFTLTIPINLK